jgi:hypothetical protein
MEPPHDPAEARLLEEFEAELRPLLDQVRDSLRLHVFAARKPGDTPLPPDEAFDAGVRLADAWAVAGAVGLPVEQLKDRLDNEDKFLVEMMSSIYSAASVAPYRQTNEENLQELFRLLREAPDPPADGS